MSGCKTCGGTSTTQPRGQIDVPCKCGSNVGVSASSIDAQRGVMVVHDTLDPNQDWEKVDLLNANTIKWVRCPCTTYVPPAVWCPSCHTNLVPQWKELCVSGTSAEVAAARQNYNPTVIHYRRMARDLIAQYGPLQRVEYLSHFPKFEINFVFERRTVYSGQRRGEYDIHFLSLGYVGEGPRYARFFLDEAGFRMSSDEIDAIRPGAVIELRDRKVVVSYPEKATSPARDTPSLADSARTPTVTKSEAGRRQRKWWRFWS